MKIIKMKDLNLSKKRVLIRSDLNVPMNPKGKITSDIRIRAALPTIKTALEKKAKVLLLAHLGSPKEGKEDKNYSLKPIVAWFKNNLPNISIHLIKNYLNQSIKLNEGELIILENVRFNKGEKKNNDSLSKKYASLCDIFVMDAFGAAHRKHSSTYGIIKFAPISCAGPLLCKELNYLKKAIYNPKKPIIAVVGGSKISTKLNLLHFLSKKVDKLIVGGGIANTCIAAHGYNIGISIYEKNSIHDAKKLLKNNNIVIPMDVSVSKNKKEITINKIQKSIHNIQNNEKILDIGNQSIIQLENIIKNAKTIIWNGPIGLFEHIDYQKGTKKLCQAIANNKNAFSIAGGGDTLSAIEMFNITKNISYMSTGGGAFLEFLTGNTLPTIHELSLRYKKLHKNDI
ncbi:MAG: phosphoglycerate kinase [Candidatus Westeberhardia cardiocondylae]|nr:phosphoglycerate kinase [Candidatus Westeberhardia cardiocondylae]